jgi:hypothetical protein
LSSEDRVRWHASCCTTTTQYIYSQVGLMFIHPRSVSESEAEKGLWS